MSCKDCSLSSSCKNSLFWGKGSSKAKYLIILDSPTWIDDKKGEVLKSDYGHKLRYLLRRAGIKKSECYVTFAVKCPVRDKSSIKKKHLDTCRKYLLHEIKKTQPKLIITMGRYAHETLTHKTSYKEYSGFFYPFKMTYKTGIGEEKISRRIKTKIIPTHCPSTSLHIWKHDIYTIHHLKKAKRFVEKGVTNTKKIPKFKRVQSLEDLDQFYKESKKYKFYTHDFETTGLNHNENEIINSGYCFDGKTAWVLYLIDEWPEDHQKKWTEEEKADADKIVKFVKKNKKRIFKVLKKVHANSARKGGANHKFDQKFAKKAGIPFKRATEDTTVKEALINENRVKSINACMELRDINYGPYDTNLYEYVGKDKKKKKPYTHIPPQLLDKYLAVDTVGCYLLNDIQDKELKKEKMEKLYRKQQVPLLKELLRIEYAGNDIDVDMLLRDADRLKKEISEKLESLKKIAKDKDFNPNSPKQVSDLLESRGYPFERFGFRKGKTGWPTGEKVLKTFMRYKKWQKLPKMLVEYRGLTKLKNTYIWNHENGKKAKGIYQYLTKDNKTHTTFNCFIPVTGRLSSDSPNNQNFPSPKWDVNMRQYFIAPPKKKDWVVWESDYSALEMRVAAFLSGDPTMTDEIKKGTDMHSANAVYFGPLLKLLSKDVTYEEFKLIAKLDDFQESELIEKYGKKEVKRFKELHPSYNKFRTFVKSVGFGLFYGMEARSLSEEHDVELEKTELAIEAFWKKYSYIHRFLTKQAKNAVERGYLQLPMTGRKRRFIEFSEWINSKEAEHIWNKKMFISKIEREAKNFPIQGFANEIFTQKVIKLIRAMRKKGMKSRINNLIHDGVVGVGPKSEMRQVEAMCHEIMTTKLKGKKNTMDLTVDFNCNSRWYGERIKDY